MAEGIVRVTEFVALFVLTGGLIFTLDGFFVISSTFYRTYIFVLFVHTIDKFARTCPVGAGTSSRTVFVAWTVRFTSCVLSFYMIYHKLKLYIIPNMDFVLEI